MTWLIYLLKVSVCMVPFYLLFIVYLQRLTFFRWNRVYLLLSLAMSWITPLLHFHLPRAVHPVVIQWTASSDPYVHPPENRFTVTASPLTSTSTLVTLQNLVLIIYIIGAVMCLLHVLYNLWRIKGLAKRQPAEYQEGYRIVDLEGIYANSSFFNTIFINKQDLSPAEQNQVLMHEKCHVRCRHSVDVMALEMMKVMLWFNRLVYLYGKSLQLVHEFEADNLATGQQNRHEYAGLLLKLNSIHSRQATLIQPFSKHPIASRIHMLFHSKSTAMQKFAYLLTIPVLLTGLFLFSCTKEIDKDLAARASLNNEILLMVDGTESPYSYLSHLKPEDITRADIINSQKMATYFYGDRAKNGAIFITTKKIKFSETIQVGFCLADDKYLLLTRIPANSQKRYKLIGSKTGKEEFTAEFGEGSFFLNGTEYNTEEIMSLHPTFINNLLKTGTDAQNKVKMKLKDANAIIADKE